MHFWKMLKKKMNLPFARYRKQGISDGKVCEADAHEGDELVSLVVDCNSPPCSPPPCSPPPCSPSETTRDDNLSGDATTVIQLDNFICKLKSDNIRKLSDKYENTLKSRLDILNTLDEGYQMLGLLTETYKEFFVDEDFLESWMRSYHQFHKLFMKIINVSPDSDTIPNLEEMLENTIETLTLLFKIRYELVRSCHQFLHVTEITDQQVEKEVIYRDMTVTSIRIQRIIGREINRCMYPEHQLNILPMKSATKMIDCITKYRKQVEEDNDGVWLDLEDFQDHLCKMWPCHTVGEVSLPLMDFQMFGLESKRANACQ